MGPWDCGVCRIGTAQCDGCFDDRDGIVSAVCRNTQAGLASASKPDQPSIAIVAVKELAYYPTVSRSHSPLSPHCLLPYLLNLIYLVALGCMAPRLCFQYVVRGKYRGTLGTRLLGLVPPSRDTRPCIWFEAASLGEVKLAEPLMRQFTRAHPEWRCVVSASTTSGYLLAKRLFPDLCVFPLPVDFTWAMRTAFRRLRPDTIVLVDLEVWPNLVRIAKDQGTQLAIVNGRMTDNDFRDYRAVRWFVSAAFGEIDFIAAQNAEYASRFVQLGAVAQNVHIVDSLKYDSSETNRANSMTQRLGTLAGIRREDVVLMAGSTHSGEEAVVLDAFGRLMSKFPQLRLILAPRHLHRFAAIERLLDRSGFSWQRRSELDTDGPDPAARVLLVDTIGELTAWWGTCHIAFVGGSMFGLRGKNMIEPAAYGAAVAFGPDTSDFRHIVQLLVENQSAVVVLDSNDLVHLVHRCLSEPGFASQLGQRARKLVLSRSGAARATLELLQKYMTRESHQVATSDVGVEKRYDVAQAHRVGVRGQGVVSRRPWAVDGGQ